MNDQESIKHFAHELSNALPTDLDEDQYIQLLFNIVLVKFGARPSTFIDNIYTTEKLIHNEKFVKFINGNHEFIVGWFATESPQPGFWIYNRKYKDLFRDKDISNMNEEYIHRIRGERLGYACPRYFLKAYEKLTLSVTMTINNHQVYGYWCPVESKYAHDAVDRWLKFRNYANALDLNLELQLNTLYI